MPVQSDAMTLKSLLYFVFGLTFLGLKYRHTEQDSFVAWSRRKKRLNMLMNKRVLEYCAGISYRIPGIPAEKLREYVYEIIVGIIDRHLLHRQTLYSDAAGINRQMYSDRAYRKCLMVELVELFKSSARVAKDFNALSYITRQEEPVNIAYQFPHHSFALADEANTAVDAEVPIYSSFGEYYSERTNAPLWALESYVRPSKRLETDGIEQSTGFLKDCSMIGKSIRPVRALGRIVSFLFFLLLLPLQAWFRKVPLLILVNHLRKKQLSRQLLALLEKCQQSEIDVTSIYVMPFNDLGLLCYTKNWSDKVVTFSYSQNIFVFPGYSSLNEYTYRNDDFNDVLADISLKSMLYKGRHAGYTNITSSLKKIKKDINQRMGDIFAEDHSVDEVERPVFLGFEFADLHAFENDQKYVGVYELPPESSETQYARAVCGDKLCDVANIKRFLQDISMLCEQGYSIVYKPKYSLVNYPVDYRQFLESLVAKYGKKFLLISPYTMASQIFSHCLLTISMPYTSTYYAAKASGNESVFYLPDTSAAWHHRSTFKDMVFGLDNLLKLVESIHSKSFKYAEASHGQ